MSNKRDEINILHLSDLHFGIDNSKRISKNRKDNRNECLRSLKETLSNLPSEWNPHVIAVSGDIGWSGKSIEYREAWLFLKSILQLFKLTSNDLVICAGNHDLNRNHPEIQKIPENADGTINIIQADELLELSELTKRMRPFKDFIQFCEEKKIPPFSLNKEKNSLIGYRDFLNIRFISLNSSWLVEKKNQHKKNLFIGLPHLQHLDSQNNLFDPIKYDESTITIILLHHPPEYFHQSEIDSYNNRPATYEFLAKRSHIILSGHSHGEVIYDPDRKFGGALLFRIGTTVIYSPYKNNCQILKLNLKTRKTNRMKLYYKPSEYLWKTEIDNNGPYNLNITKLEHLTQHEILQRIVDYSQEKPDFIEPIQNSMGLISLFDMLSLFIPPKLPILKKNRLNTSNEFIRSNEELNRLRSFVEKLDNIHFNLLDLDNDWLSQRVWFLAGNFWYFFHEFERANVFYCKLKDKNPLIHIETRELSFERDLYEFNRGVTLALIKSLESLEAFDNALSINPNMIEALINKSTIQNDLGMHKEAIETSDLVIKLNPSFGQAWINKAEALMRIGKSKEALNVCRYCIKNKMNRIAASLLEGNILWEMEEYDKAKRSYQKLVKLPIDQPEDIFNRSTALIRLNRVEEAVKHFDILLKKGFDKEVIYVNKGAAFLEEKRYDEALAMVDKAISCNPKSSTAYLNKSIILLELNRYQEAILSSQQAINLSPDKINARIVQTKIYFANKNLEKASDSINEALNIRNDSFESLKLAGHIALEMGEYIKSEGYFKLASKINSRVSEIWHNIGKVQSIRQKYKEAINSYNKSLKIEPNQGVVYYNKALSLENLEEYDKAIKAYKKAINIDTSNSRALLHLSVCYISKNKQKEAISYLLKAFETDKNNLNLAKHLFPLQTILNTPKIKKIMNQFEHDIKKEI